MSKTGKHDSSFTLFIYSTHGSPFRLDEVLRGTFQLVVLGVGGEQDVGEELLEAVAGVARPVLHVGPHRLVQLHQELQGRRSQLLDHLVPLVDVWFRFQ